MAVRGDRDGDGVRDDAYGGSDESEQDRAARAQWHRETAAGVAKPISAATKAAREAKALRDKQQDIIRQLGRVSRGGGTAYGKTMAQVGAGNDRIKALASSGRGGLNAGVNAGNAVAANKVTGTNQAVSARAGEMAMARSAYGNAIAQGQDMNMQDGRDALTALANQQQDPNNLQRDIGMVGNLGQAAWSMYSSNQKEDPNKAKNQTSYKNWA